MQATEAEITRLYDTVITLTITYGWSVIGAILILLIGWTLAGWAERTVARMLGRLSTVDGTLKPFMASLTRYGIMALTVIAVLAQFGVQTASIIALLGAAGIAVGLALQGTLQNIAAGIMLLILRPLKVGDYIDAEGIAGTVHAIGLFLTELETFDGVYRSVPNAQLWSRQILNYTRLPNRRIDHTVGISYGDSIDAAFAALSAVMQAEARILPEPPPQVMVMALADSSVNINMRCWCRREDYWNLLFDLRKQSKEALDAAGITIPFPQRDVHLHGAPPAADDMPPSISAAGPKAE
tara:strand:+ start:832 stop:1719 length:888 start_codon:yes stop_codon:yes gene_type:complete